VPGERLRGSGQPRLAGVRFYLVPRTAKSAWMAAPEEPAAGTYANATMTVS